MRANLAPGFVLLIALVAGCAVEKPMSPERARRQIGVYSQHEFLAAAGEGDLRTVKLFVQAGMDVNAQSPNNNYDTALMRAAGGGHLKVVQYLYNQGADLYVENGQCVGDLVDEVRFEDPTFCNEQDALIWAAWQGRLGVVEWLIKQRKYIPHIGWIDYRYGPDSAMMIAAYGGQLEVVKHLRKHIHPNYRDYLDAQDTGALGWAAHQGHLGLVKHLVKKEARINPSTLMGGTRGTGTTPLMMASAQGHEDVVEYLLDKGADIHVREAYQFISNESVFTAYGASALSATIAHGQDEVMQILVDHWVYTYGTDGIDDHGRTVLMYAASWGNMDAVRFLVANGAPIGAWTRVGSTALMFAAAAGHTEVVRFLLEQGEDPHAVNTLGYTALRLAQERGHTEVASLLNSIG